MARGAQFLERQTYRRRRMIDGARLLPVIGGIAFVMPILWRTDTTPGASTAHGGLYLFAIWFGLILAAFALSRRLRNVAGDGRVED